MTVLNRSFNRVTETIKDFTPIWNAVKREFHDIEAENFQSENVKGASGRWAKLSVSYEKQKLAKRGTFALLAGVLRDTDDLYMSLTRDTSNSVYRPEKQSMEIGTSLKYAKYHQNGTDRMPARPPIDLSAIQKRKLTKAIQKELLPFVRQSGLVLDESNYKDLG